MQIKGKYCMNIATPNLVNICVDQHQNDEISGRLYHCYSAEPVMFSNIIELLREAEKLFDDISFPQASTKTRSLVEKTHEQSTQIHRLELVVDRESVVNHSGRIGTFITSVRFRQNSTWQGESYWIEKETVQQFANTLEFIKQIDIALQ